MAIRVILNVSDMHYRFRLNFVQVKACGDLDSQNPLPDPMPAAVKQRLFWMEMSGLSTVQKYLSLMPRAHSTNLLGKSI